MAVKRSTHCFALAVAMCAALSGCVRTAVSARAAWPASAAAYVSERAPAERRAPGWASLRNRFIAAHPRCAGCGAAASVAHHVEPVSLNPSRELDAENLVPFCDRCHLMIGHLGCWSSYNADAVADAAWWRAKLSRRPKGIRP